MWTPQCCSQRKSAEAKEQHGRQTHRQDENHPQVKLEASAKLQVGKANKVARGGKSPSLKAQKLTQAATLPSCPNGFYQKKISQNACEELEEGFIAQAGGSSSAKVAPGYRINQSCIDTGESCREPTAPCPAGTRSTNVSSEYCVGCPIGWSSPGAAAQCTECNKGEYGAPLADSEFEGAHQCQPCGLNHFREATSSPIKCDKCPSGYSTGNKTGESSCLKNPGLTPDNCGPTQFLRNKNPDPSAYETWSCETCPLGGMCEGPVEWHDVVGPANESRIRAMFGWSRCSQTGSTVENMFERCPF